MLAAGHEQRRLSEPVAGIEGCGAEARRREAAGKTLQGRAADRLGAVEGGRPTAQVELVDLLGAHLPYAELVGEARAAAGRRAVARDSPQPPRGLLQEGLGRHEDALRARVDGLQDVADEPHVVEEREPAHDHRALVLREGDTDGLLVVHEVAVPHHDALRRRGRARGVLQERQVPGGEPRLPPVRGGLAGNDVRRQPGEIAQLRVVLAERRRLLQERGRRQHYRRARVEGDRLQPRIAAARPRQAARHRGHLAEQAAVERVDELEPRRIEQEGPLAGADPLLERRGHRPRPEIEISERQSAGLPFSILEKCERPPFRRGASPHPQRLDHGREHGATRAHHQCAHPLHRGATLRVFTPAPTSHLKDQTFTRSSRRVDH